MSVTLIQDRSGLSTILEAVAETLDVPDHVYEDAILKYENVGQHLADDESELNRYSPQIYVQGSFRLGTVVQPISRNDEYDVDLVCRLEIPKDDITQSDLKAKVGDRLKARSDLGTILDESRRCWVLNYPKQAGMPGFHMDVLPSIPNEDATPSGILVTDTDLHRWQTSNPILYSEWFKSRMEIVLQSRRAAFADSISASVEEIPEWQVKTPLQRCIQILKRHRDTFFESSPDKKPISIIITTLAALAYSNEEDVFDSLGAIVKGMPHFIENRDGQWWVPNPVEPSENFAHKWNEDPERPEAFMRWLGQVRTDVDRVAEERSAKGRVALMQDSLGHAIMSRVATRLEIPQTTTALASRHTEIVVPPLGDASHALPASAQFRMGLSHGTYVKVTAGVYYKNKRGPGRFLWPLRRTVPKNVWLKFTARTNYKGRHSVKWQIVNTGQEAVASNQPRGDFYPSEEPSIRWESTAYRGTHWVEAFLLDESGTCIARSDRFLVPVR
jgi:hypothetical protein